MTTTPATEELDVPVPDYVDRVLALIAERTRKSKEDVTLFFLLKEVEHTRPVFTPSPAHGLPSQSTAGAQ